jgi:replicative DNA helicase
VNRELAKALPSNLEAERAVLGAGMLNQNSLVKILGALSDRHFCLSDHRVVFMAFQSLFASAKPVDLLTVTEHLQVSGQLERAGGPGYLSKLLDGVPSLSNVEHYAAIVREQAKRRELIHFGERVQCLAWGEVAGKDNSDLSADAIASFAVDSALQIAAGEDSPVTLRPWAEVADSAFREIEKAHDHPESVRRFRSGVNSVDEMTGGMRPKELVVIVAPTSNGKTQFASQCAMQADRDGFSSLYFSAEMPAEQIVQREIAFQAGVKFFFVRRPDKLSAEEMERLKQASLRECQIQFVDRDITPTRVWAMAEAAKKSRALDILFVDYDQLVIEAGIDPNGDEDNVFRHQRAFVLAAKRLAERLDICVVLLCQLRKVSPKISNGAQPRLDDIWGDSSIRNTPHLILWLSREFFTHDMDRAYERKANLYVLKSRNDRTGIVPLEFDPERVRFLEAPPTEADSTQDRRGK